MPAIKGFNLKAIQVIQQTENLSMDDFGNVMMLLTTNHEVDSIYLAIDNPEQRTCYVEKQHGPMIPLYSSFRKRSLLCVLRSL